MAANFVTFALVLLAITTSSINASSQENVPLIAWSNSESLASVTSLAAVPLSSSLNNILYIKEKIIVFVQNKLSFDDLAKYGGIYGSDSGSLKNIEQLVRYSTSSATLSVPYQPNLVDFLVKELSFMFMMGDGVYFFSAEDLQSSDAQFVNSQCKLCVISLPESSSSFSSERASQLTKIDEFVNMVMSKNVVKKENYIAMLAAKSSQEYHDDKVVLSRMARQADYNTNGTCANDTRNPSIHYCRNVNHTDDSNTNNDTCFFNMRFEHIMVNVGNSTHYIIEFNSTQDPQPDSIPCNNISVGNATGIGFSVKYTANTSTDITITFFFVKKTRTLPNGFWRLNLGVEADSLLLSRTNLTYKKELLPPYPLDVPYRASFHCSDATYCVERDPITDRCDRNYPVVKIYGLQAELFTDKFHSEFSIAFDCEPYFSATTWMGILTLSVLLPILIIGLYAVFQTQTMDRFDDPREPQLVTTVTE